MKREILQFHAICFCASVEGGNNQDDLASFMLVRQYLGDIITQHTCLILTRSESKTDEQRMALLDEMRKQKQYNELIDFFRGGIYFSGALNFDDWNLALEDKLMFQFRTIIRLRKQLLDFFRQKTTSLEMMNLNFNDVKTTLEERKMFVAQIDQLKQQGSAKVEEIQSLQDNLDKKGCNVM